MNDFALGIIFGISALLLILWLTMNWALSRGDIILRKYSWRDNIHPENIGDVRPFGVEE